MPPDTSTHILLAGDPAEFTIIRESRIVTQFKSRLTEERARQVAAEYASALLENYARIGLSHKRENESGVTRLRQIGTRLWNICFPDTFDRTAHLGDGLIALSVPENLQSVPFEILYDKQFLTVQNPVVRELPGQREFGLMNSTSYLFNPTLDRNLESGKDNKERIVLSILRQMGLSEFKKGKLITADFFLSRLKSADLAVFNGHGENGFIQMADRILLASEIQQSVLSNLRLFINNSCFSTSLSRAFIEAGVQNMTGFASLVSQDEVALLTRDVLQAIVQGQTFANAVHAARCASFTRAPELLVWAQHQAFGYGGAHLAGARKPIRARPFESFSIASTFAAVLVLSLSAITLYRSCVLERRIENVDAKFDQLLAALNAADNRLVEHPVAPEDFLRNFIINKRAGRFEAAQESFESYSKFNIQALEPHYQFQDLLIRSHGKSVAKARYEQFPRNDFFEFLRILLDEDSHSQLNRLNKIKDRFPPAKPEIVIVLVRIGADSNRIGEALAEAKAVTGSPEFLAYYLDRDSAQQLLHSIEKSAASRHNGVTRTDDIWTGFPIAPTLVRDESFHNLYRLQGKMEYDGRLFRTIGPASAVVQFYRNTGKVFLEKTVGDEQKLVLYLDPTRRVTLAIGHEVCTVTISRVPIGNEALFRSMDEKFKEQ